MTLTQKATALKDMLHAMDPKSGNRDGRIFRMLMARIGAAKRYNSMAQLDALAGDMRAVGFPIPWETPADHDSKPIMRQITENRFQAAVEIARKVCEGENDPNIFTAVLALTSMMNGIDASMLDAYSGLGNGLGIDQDTFRTRLVDVEKTGLVTRGVVPPRWLKGEGTAALGIILDAMVLTGEFQISDTTTDNPTYQSL